VLAGTTSACLGYSEAAVKKLLLLVLAGVGAFAVWRKMESDKAEQDLWAQATDSV
jgi:hypothetical protein